MAYMKKVKSGHLSSAAKGNRAPKNVDVENMARLGRFELPTSGFGDQRSIHLSYRRAAWLDATDFVILACPNGRRQSAFARSQPPRKNHPFERDLISRASFSISSAFLTISRESTRAESVFSTVSFSSLAS